VTKVPEFIYIDIEPIDSKGFRSKKKLLLTDHKEVTSLDLRLLIRFSKHHFRYHEYKIKRITSFSLELEKLK